MRYTTRLIALGWVLAGMVSGASAEDVEFQDFGPGAVLETLSGEPESDIDVSNRTIRRVLRQQALNEAAREDTTPSPGKMPAAWTDLAADRAVETTESGLYAAVPTVRTLRSDTRKTVVTGSAGPAKRDDLGIAVLRGRPGENISPDAAIVPQILGEEDVRLYREIFRVQERRKWKRADKLVDQLTDRSLLGHVLYQRYMHPTGYRAKYKELRRWMVQYRDHPGAKQIYKMAIRRRPKNNLYPPKPVRELVARLGTDNGDRYAQRAGYYRLSGWKRRYIRQTQRRIRRHIDRNRVTRALRLLTSKKSVRIFDEVSLDESRSDVAGGLFHIGKNEKAMELAGPAAFRSGHIIPLAHWWAGLAAWRLGKYEMAASHFEYMTQANLRSDWSLAAAAYWAGRAYLISGQPEKVNGLLKLAARYPRTFYGLLAIRSLGMEPAYDWSLPPVGTNEWNSLEHLPNAQRAMELIQVGQPIRAGNELKRVYHRVPQEVARTLVTLANHHNLPSLALKIGRTLRDRDGEIHDAALYPLPDWEPKNGFTIDRALVFAVMRQESRFSTRAKSRAGARGLMQLMPRTAGYMAGRRFRGSRRHQLFNPELNISLGQKYVHHLLKDPNIDGDLFFTVAAYNGGPGNLRKWRRRGHHGTDPLMFIESIPLKETRIYVERVLTNLWIYRYRLGQPSPSLDAIAAGEWPSYTPLDRKRKYRPKKASTGL